jgi:galactokinase/mevalonate kinase-like predicted kinase
MTQEMFSNAFLIISMRGRESTNTTIDHLKELASKLEASGNKLRGGRGGGGAYGS